MSSSSQKKQIVKLNSSHDLEGFDCGVSALNNFLIKFALQNQNANSSNTYIALEGNTIVGYYSLLVGSVIHAKAPNRVIKGLSKNPVPVMILARLAVDKDFHSKGIGKGLLKDALLRTVHAADIAGIRAFLIHAKDDTAKKWYLQFDFMESPTDPLHLFLLLKDLKKIIFSNS